MYPHHHFLPPTHKIQTQLIPKPSPLISTLSFTYCITIKLLDKLISHLIKEIIIVIIWSLAEMFVKSIKNTTTLTTAVKYDNADISMHISHKLLTRFNHLWMLYKFDLVTNISNFFFFPLFPNWNKNEFFEQISSIFQSDCYKHLNLKFWVECWFTIWYFGSSKTNNKNLSHFTIVRKYSWIPYNVHFTNSYFPY